MRRRILITLAFAALLTSPFKLAHAQSLSDAETLPQGVGGLIVQPAYGYGPGVLQRFGDGWTTSRESLISDFDGIDLTNVIASNEAEAALINLALGGDLGTTSFDISQNSILLNLIAAFGVTDRLTIAAQLPIQWVRYKLDATLIPTGNQAPFRIDNPEAITCPNGSFDITDVNAIGQQVNGYSFHIGDLGRVMTSKCLGYIEPFDIELGDDGLFHGLENRTVGGPRDLALGFKYQLYHGRYIHLGLLGFTIAPTGRVNDPNRLIDFKLGDGNWSVAGFLGMTLPLGRFQIGMAAGYELELPDKERLRLPSLGFDDATETALANGDISEKDLFRRVDDGNFLPLVTRFDVVEAKRDLGDNIYVYSYFNYQVFEWLSVGLTVNFLHHFRDRITEIGPRPEGAPAYPTEEAIRAEVDRLIASGEINEDDKTDELKARLAESDGRKKAAYSWRTVRGQLSLGIGININTLPLFVRGEFPIPLIISLSGNRFIAGQNIDTPDAIGLSIALPFAFGDVKDPAEFGYDFEEGGGMPFP